MNRLFPCRVPRRVAALLILAVATGAAVAQPDATRRRSIDPSTGRNLLNYPPHRLVEVRHIRLHVRIPDMNDRTMLATETLTVAPVAQEASVVTLNAALLQVSSVTCPGRDCTYERNDAEQTLVIHLDPTLPRGETTEVTIGYRVSDPTEGLTWIVESRDHPGRAAQVYSQGESESNRYWLAGHDSPNARCTTEIIATVPRGYQVVSNGRLQSRTRENLEPYDTFHWVQDKPHAMYLVTLAVGKWDVVDVGTPRLPMPVYVPVGQGERVRDTFGRTPRMVDMLSRVIGEPYPWAKYAQVAVHNFGWGGMENTSATTMYGSVALDRRAFQDGDQDELIVHELAHQWFGDLLTCRTWEHIWLNEGFATYVEALWAQYKASPIPSGGAGVVGMRADDGAYLATVWGWMEDVSKSDVGAAPYQPGMASKQYDSPDEVFDREANPYPKGALLLHMLREKLGDEVFFRGLAAYVQKHKFQQVETFQFREAMERAGGVSLQRFFDQWAYRPLVPRVRVSPSYDASSRTLSVAFEQTQPIDGYNPTFDLSVPVWVRPRGGSDWKRLHASFDTRRFTLTAPLPAEPDMVLVDPELSVLADLRVELDSSQWRRQLAGGPMVGARLRAAKALGHTGGSADDAAALERVVRDERSLRELRVAAAAALGTIGTPATTALRGLLSAKLDDARVRAAVILHAAGVAAHADEDTRRGVATALASAFANDPSYAVRAAAVRGMGTLKDERSAGVIDAALRSDSQHNQVRRAAVGAIADLDRSDAAAVLIGMTRPGNSADLRADAVAALPKVASRDPDRVFSALAELLDDREVKTASAAGQALSDIGGERARTLLEQRLPSLTSRYWQGKTRAWLRSMTLGADATKASASP